MPSTTSRTSTRTRVRPSDGEVILGLDPGLTRVGFAVLRVDRRQPRLLSCGTLDTSVFQRRGERLKAIARGVRALIERYRPARAACEQLFFQTNVKTALAVSEARGVLLYACAEAAVPVVEFTPTEVKQVVTGWGTADKRMIQKMVRLVLRLPEAPADDDAADAVAVALTSALHPRPPHGS